MELVEAKLLQSVIDANPPLDFVEKRTITRHMRASRSKQSDCHLLFVKKAGAAAGNVWIASYTFPNLRHCIGISEACSSAVDAQWF